MTQLLHTFEADSCPRVWLAAAEFLNRQPSRSAHNVILAARTPGLLTAADFAICDCVDAFLRSQQRLPVATVASTIFPANFYMQRGAPGIYDDFVRLYPLMPRRWGHYAARMLSRSVVSARNHVREINPLRILVEKMRKQVAGGHMRAVYEVNMVEDWEPLELPVYDTARDTDCTRGQPCLSHLSFKLLPVEQEVMLTVLYRHHYYIEKALGNLIGLAQLLCFVAAEADVGVGTLICHSTLAELDSGSWGVDGIARLIEDCRDAPAVAKPT
jgi:hypothetical protein